MMRLRRLHWVIWPLLAAFLFLFWGVGLGTVAAQEPEYEWYLVPLPIEAVSLVAADGSNHACTLTDWSHECTHTASGWGRHHYTYDLVSPVDLGLTGFDFTAITDENNRQPGYVYAVIMNGYSSNGWRIDATSPDGLFASTRNFETTSQSFDGNICFGYRSFIGNAIPEAAGIDCEFTHYVAPVNWLPSPTSYRLSWGWRANSSGAQSHGVRSFSYLVYGVPPTPPPPPPAPIGFNSSCALVIDNGAILTATTSITAAQTITTGQLITVSANLANNGGFELSDNSITPSGWQFTNGLYVPNLWSGLAPFEGSRHLHSDLMPEIVASQSISLPTAPNYQISAAVRAEHGAAAQTLFVRLGLDTLNVPFSDEPYTVYSTTVQTAGERQLRVEIPDTTGLASPVSVDNVAVIPVEGDALSGYSVFCAAVGEHYLESNNIQPPPPGGTGGPGTLIGYQLPTFMEAGQCLVCPTPTFAATSIGGALQSIANWFSWLYCGLRTLVTCYIYVWIYNITVYVQWFASVFISSFNWGMFIFNEFVWWIWGGAGVTMTTYFAYFLGFRNSTGMLIEILLDAIGTNSGEVIYNGLISMGLTPIAEVFAYWVDVGNYITSAGENGSNLVIDWFAFVFILTRAAWSIAVATITGLSNVIIAIITLVFRIVNALREAVTADAVTIQMWAEEGELGSEFMVAFLWTLSTVDDTLFVLRLIPIIYMGVAGFALMLMYWLVNKWSISIF